MQYTHVYKRKIKLLYFSFLQVNRQTPKECTDISGHSPKLCSYRSVNCGFLA